MTPNEHLPEPAVAPAGRGARPATSHAPPEQDITRRARRRALLGQVGVPVILLLLVAFFGVTASEFLSSANIKTIFSDAAFPLLAALGLTVCLAMGEFDLSLNGVAGLATITVAVLVSREAWGALPAIVVTLVLVGVLIGGINGLFVGFVGLNALIVTVAINSGLLGLQYVVSGSRQIYGGFPEGFVSFCRGSVGPVPNMVIVAGATAVLIWALLEHTTLGRHMRAVGGNAEAARIAGVDVARTRLWGFVLCALMAALAGTLFAGRQTTAFPLSGLDILLPSYAACFIGAAAFKIGEFNVPGTIIGVLMASVTANGLLLMGVPPYATYLFQGAILLLALLFARIVSRRRAGV